MSYSWFRKGSCTTVNGSEVVRFNAATITTAPNKPVVGDAFTVDGVNLYEVIFIGSDATGEFIRLKGSYKQASASNADYAFMRLASSTQNAKLVAMAAAAINQKQISLDDMYEWYTSTDDTVDFLGPDGATVTLTTYLKLTNEISNVGGSSGQISIVSDNIQDVKIVASNIAEVVTTALNMGNITTVSLNMAAVNAVSIDIESVNNVSANMSSVINVSDNLQEIFDGAMLAFAVNVSSISTSLRLNPII